MDVSHVKSTGAVNSCGNKPQPVYPLPHSTSTMFLTVCAGMTPNVCRLVDSNYGITPSVCHIVLMANQMTDQKKS